MSVNSGRPSTAMAPSALPLLHNADHGVDQRDAPDHQGIAGMARGQLDAAHQRQGDQQRIVELQQNLQAGLPPRLVMLFAPWS